MNKFVKMSAVGLVVAGLIAPTTAAFAQNASVTNSNAMALVHAVPGDRLVSILGFSAGGNSAGNATTIRIVDVSDIYDGDTLKDVDEALRSHKRSAVAALRAGLASGADVGVYLQDLNIDPNSVLAIEKDGSAVNVYVS